MRRTTAGKDGNSRLNRVAFGCEPEVSLILSGELRHFLVGPNRCHPNHLEVVHIAAFRHIRVCHAPDTLVGEQSQEKGLRHTRCTRDVDAAPCFRKLQGSEEKEGDMLSNRKAFRMHAKL